jgi:hypothetical protein
MSVLGTLQMRFVCALVFFRRIFTISKRTSPIHEAFCSLNCLNISFGFLLFSRLFITNHHLPLVHLPTARTQVDRLSTLHEQRLALLENEFESELRLTRSEFDAELHGIQVCAVDWTRMDRNNLQAALISYR